MRPILNYYNDENSIINPYMGFSTYFLSEKYKTPYAYCGTIGVEYWIKEKNPTWRAGFGFKYILGTNNINMIQLSMIAKILKF